MESDKKNFDSVYSKKVRAGRRRTYFFDVRTTRSNDYYITMTESKRKFDEDGYERHKLFLYKEDFNKFVEGLSDTVNHIKTELMPDYDFDEFTRPLEDGTPYQGHVNTTPEVEEAAGTTEEVAESVAEEIAETSEAPEAPEAPEVPEAPEAPEEEPINEDDLKWD